MVVATVDELDALLLVLDDGADLDKDELTTALLDGAHLLVSAMDKVLVGDTAAVVVIVVVLAVAVAESVPVAVAVVKLGLLDGDNDLNLLVEGLLLDLEALAVVNAVKVEDKGFLREIKLDAAVELLLTAMVTAVVVAGAVVVAVTVVTVVLVLEAVLLLLATALVVLVLVAVVTMMLFLEAVLLLLAAALVVLVLVAMVTALVVVLVAVVTALVVVLADQVPEAALLVVLLGEEEGVGIRDVGTVLDLAAAIEVAAVGAVEVVEVLEEGKLLESSSSESTREGSDGSGTHVGLPVLDTSLVKTTVIDLGRGL